MLNTKDGITLVALIVTVVVLVALCGVVVNSIVGDNGIVNKATLESEEAERLNAKEELETYVIDLKTTSIRNGKDLTTEELVDALSRNKTIVIKNTISNMITGEYKGYSFLIDEDTVYLNYLQEDLDIKVNFNNTVINEDEYYGLVSGTIITSEAIDKIIFDGKKVSFSKTSNGYKFNNIMVTESNKYSMLIKTTSGNVKIEEITVMGIPEVE